MNARTLFLSPRATATGHALADSARRRAMRVEALHEWRVPDEWRAVEGASLYAGPLFADAVGAELGLGLLEAAPDWLARLPYELTGREIEFSTLAEARQLRRPAFVKPPNDKSFPARVYPDGSRLPGPDAVDDGTPVLVSDIVTFAVEYRLFLLDGEVRTGSRYLTDGDLDVAPLDGDPRRAEVLAFAEQLSSLDLPSAVVVDVGLLSEGLEWVVVEANAAWASGHYACDPDAALDVVLHAARPEGEFGPADRAFLRPLPEVVWD
ncbi:ATP-grasp domain-containing protein [Streptomyces sp. ME02-8801-2C]|uniref:ATP-grasp domain-containing protein n=1 Tax=Streptomyces sp. ME02-8801-2C TaxID=3028680 RepID=UPI0029BC01AE|nr:ATP-grasp domain-containing protein [Streptomyces sp. ME02-8801-2C]MDX3452903.1 ATP-grasp domain-containing protein [Streptomyces sp. ME02-8801-2C]